MSDDEHMPLETGDFPPSNVEQPNEDSIEQPMEEEEIDEKEADKSEEVKDEDDYEPPAKQTKSIEPESSKSLADQEDSFRRFEKLLAKTENFSRCLSAGDVFLCKNF